MMSTDVYEGPGAHVTAYAGPRPADAERNPLMVSIIDESRGRVTVTADEMDAVCDAWSQYRATRPGSTWMTCAAADRCMMHLECDHYDSCSCPRAERKRHV